jgi:hypothetical protein
MPVVASCCVRVCERSQLREQSFLRESGEPWAWLYVGEHHEVSIYGPPAALRRLGAAVIAAADAAERLAGELEHADEGAPAAA